MSSTADVRLTQVDRRACEVRTPGERIPGVRRIVVARTDRLGDVVLSLPALDALRRAYPEARIALMLRRSLHPLGRMVRQADDLLPAPEGLRSAIRSLREHGTDLLVCVSRDSILPCAGFLARVRHRIGTGYRIYSPLFTRRVEERRKKGARHELEYALSFAHRAGAAPAAPSFPLDVSEEAREKAGRWLEASSVRDGFVLMHPGTGGSCPAWPVESHLRLAELLVSASRAVVFSVGPADATVRQALDRSSAAVRDLPRTGAGIEELAALTLRAGAVVSNSTGPLHLAAALGVPTLGFYAPWPSCGVTRWGPYAENGWALVAEREEARRWARSRRRRDGADLLTTISPEVAVETLEKISSPGTRASPRPSPANPSRRGRARAGCPEPRRRDRR